MKPIIGITTSGRNENLVQSPYYDEYFVVPSPYVDAVSKAGGIPLLIPPIPDDIERLLSIVDGIIISGGGDIEPQRYGGNAQHPALTRQDTERDALEIEIIQQIVASKEKPVLCVCRGMQVLNVALGGTLHEHIPDIREQDTHRNEDGFWIVHEVNVKAESKLASAMQAETVHTFSGHHQAIDKIAENLKVVASSPDDIVEALEHTEHPWIIGVQWHPEKSARSDKTQQNLFDKLVELAQVGLRKQIT